MTEQGTLKVAIVGTGAIAHAHARVLGARPAGVGRRGRGPQPGRAGRVRRPVRRCAGRYDSLDALLAAETVDVVHLCTPPGLHKDQAITALRAGAHVVCEKPPVLSLADLDAVARGRPRGRSRVRGGVPAAHRDRRRARAEAARRRHARAPARRRLPHALVPQAGGLLRGAVAREVGDGGRRAAARARHPPARPARVPAGRVGRGRRPRVPPGPRPGDRGHVDGGDPVRQRRDRVRADHRAGAAPGQLRAGRHHARHGRGRAPLRARRPRVAAHPGARRGPAASRTRRPSSWTLPVDDEPSGHTPLLRAVYAALRAGEPLPPVAADPHRSLELVTAIYASATLGRPVTKADLAPGSTLRDGFLHGIEDLRPGMTSATPRNVRTRGRPDPHECGRNRFSSRNVRTRAGSDAARVRTSGGARIPCSPTRWARPPIPPSSRGPDGTWWLFATQRRVDDDGPGVSWVHGTDIAVATSDDGGLTWTHRGVVDGWTRARAATPSGRPRSCSPRAGSTCSSATSPACPEPLAGARAAHPAPRVRRPGDLGVPRGRAAELGLRHRRLRRTDRPTGYRMWFKDEAAGSTTWCADSDDLETWGAVAAGHRGAARTKARTCSRSAGGTG